MTAGEGAPRQHMDLDAQQRAYRHALDHLADRDDIDADRLGVFGTSMSGGHALALASTDARIRSTVVLVPFTGLDLSAYPAELLSVVEEAAKNLAAGEEPQMIASVGHPGDFAVMTGDGAWDWMERMTADAPSYRNEVTLASLWNLANYRSADKLQASARRYTRSWPQTMPLRRPRQLVRRSSPSLTSTSSRSRRPTSSSSSTTCRRPSTSPPVGSPPTSSDRCRHPTWMGGGPAGLHDETAGDRSSTSRRKPVSPAAVRPSGTPSGARTARTACSTNPPGPPNARLTADLQRLHGITVTRPRFTPSRSARTEPPVRGRPLRIRASWPRCPRRQQKARIHPRGSALTCEDVVHADRVRSARATGLITRRLGHGCMISAPGSGHPLDSNPYRQHCNRYEYLV